MQTQNKSYNSGQPQNKHHSKNQLSSDYIISAAKMITKKNNIICGARLAELTETLDEINDYMIDCLETPYITKIKYLDRKIIIKNKTATRMLAVLAADIEKQIAEVQSGEKLIKLKQKHDRITVLEIEEVEANAEEESKENLLAFLNNCLCFDQIKSARSR